MATDFGEDEELAGGNGGAGPGVGPAGHEGRSFADVLGGVDAEGRHQGRMPAAGPPADPAGPAGTGGAGSGGDAEADGSVAAADPGGAPVADVDGGVGGGPGAEIDIGDADTVRVDRARIITAGTENARADTGAGNGRPDNGRNGKNGRGEHDGTGRYGHAFADGPDALPPLSEFVEPQRRAEMIGTPPTSGREPPAYAFGDDGADSDGGPDRRRDTGWDLRASRDADPEGTGGFGWLGGPVGPAGFVGFTDPSDLADRIDQVVAGSDLAALDDWGDEASLVRPYAWTRGRTRANYDLKLETLVSTTEVGQREALLSQVEHRSVSSLCRYPHSVAEVAAKLSIPLGVARVILSDMAELGLISIHRTFADDDIAAHLVLMERVLSGLRRL